MDLVHFIWGVRVSLKFVLQRGHIDYTEKKFQVLAGIALALFL
jgi:hypothetical protein